MMAGPARKAAVGGFDAVGCFCGVEIALKVKAGGSLCVEDAACNS